MLRVGIATDQRIIWSTTSALQWPVFVSCPWRPRRFNTIPSAVCSRSAWISGRKESK